MYIAFIFNILCTYFYCFLYCIMLTFIMKVHNNKHLDTKH